MPLRDIVRYCLKPLGDALRGLSDEVISARLLNGHSGLHTGRTEAVPAASRTGACGSLMEKTARVSAYQADSRMQENNAQRSWAVIQSLFIGACGG